MVVGAGGDLAVVAQVDLRRRGDGGGGLQADDGRVAQRRAAEHDKGVTRRAVAVNALVTATPPAAGTTPARPFAASLLPSPATPSAAGSGKASPPTMRVHHRHRSLSSRFSLSAASRRRADARSLRAAHAVINSRCLARADFYWVQFGVVAAAATTLGPKQASKAASMMASLTACAVAHSRRKPSETHITEWPRLPCQPMLPIASASRSLRARCVRESLSHSAIAAVDTMPVGMRAVPAAVSSMPAISQSMTMPPLSSQVN